MRIVKIIGTVTLNRSHETMRGATLKMAVPLTLENLQNPGSKIREEFEVVWDDLGAGIGDLIALADGPEACRPFRPNKKPVSAYCAAILDIVTIK
jgi:ethanolamine utilization protein EutN